MIDQEVERIHSRHHFGVDRTPELACEKLGCNVFLCGGQGSGRQMPKVHND